MKKFGKLVEDLEGVAVGVMVMVTCTLGLREVYAYETNGQQFVGLFADNFTSLISGIIVISAANWWTWRNVGELIDNEKRIQALLLTIVDSISSLVLMYFFWQRQIPSAPWPPAPQNIFPLFYWTILTTWTIWMIICLGSQFHQAERIQHNISTKSPTIKAEIQPKKKKASIIQQPAPEPPTQKPDKERDRLIFWTRMYYLTLVLGMGGTVVAAFVLVFIIPAVILLFHATWPIKLVHGFGDPAFYAVYLINLVVMFCDCAEFWSYCIYRQDFEKRWPLQPPTGKEKGPYISCLTAIGLGCIDFYTFQFFVPILHLHLEPEMIVPGLILIVNIGIIIKNWVMKEVPQS